MGLKEIQIVFDNPWSTYYCGQPVTGRILINVDTPKKIRGIVIKFKGEANVSFQRSETRRDSDGKSHSVTRTYTGNESYFENKYNLVGGNSGEIMLQPGEACYPFQTILPPNLPSSFEGEHGHVRYTVKVTIDRPWKFDQEAKAAYTVISPLDLNLMPMTRNPVKLTQEKYFCCCCCRSGPLTLVAMIPHSGFVSGQKIPVTVEVDNISNQEISDVTCTLRKNLSFHAKSPNRETEHSKIAISKISFGSVGKNGSETWAKLFDIPPLPPSNLANCSLIDLDYDLKFEGRVSGMCHRNVDLKIPITLGTIPLQEFAPAPVPGGYPAPGMQPAPGGYPSPGMQPSPGGYPAPGMQPVPGTFPTPEKSMGPGFQDPGIPAVPSMPSAPGMSSGPEGWANPPPAYPGYPQGGPSLYPSLPPPTFAEAMGEGGKLHEEGDSEFMQGDQRFTPRYPMYNYANASAPPME